MLQLCCSSVAALLQLLVASAASTLRSLSKFARILLYMHLRTFIFGAQTTCPHTAIYVAASTFTLCLHTTIYVSSYLAICAKHLSPYSFICALVFAFAICPRTTIYVSSCYYICGPKPPKRTSRRFGPRIQ
jgi:hypothetical protein